MWKHFLSRIPGRTSGLVTRRRMSRLTARIMAIMLFPLAIFLVGLLSLDQYRTTLIQSEFVALERQGFTLARSLALAEAARDRRVARRQLSPETIQMWRSGGVKRKTGGGRLETISIIWWPLRLVYLAPMTNCQDILSSVAKVPHIMQK